MSFSMYRWMWAGLFIGGWVTTIHAQTPVFEDLLTNSSKITGQRGSGSFSANGYTLTQSVSNCSVTGNPRSGDFVYYEFPRSVAGGSWAQGSIEWDLVGLASQSCPEWNEHIAICDSNGLSTNPAFSNGTFYDSLYYSQQRKLNEPANPEHINKMKPTAKCQSVNFEQRTNVLSWDASTIYRFRITWSGTQMRWYRGTPGQPLTYLSPPGAASFAANWNPVMLHIQLGSTFRSYRTGYSGGVPGNRYSLIRVYNTDLGNAATPLRDGTPATLAFTDITSSSGTGGPNWFGGHGVEWADVTGDGRPDFYVTMNFDTNMGELFYRNINGGTFAEEANARGIYNYDSGSHGGVWADLDNDGDYDLVNGSYERNRAYENNGSGYFTDRTLTCGFENVNLGTRGTLAFDFDKDGDLDVFCNNWGPSEQNEFYRNNGNWTFTRIDNGLRNISGVQGVTEGDYDNDGDLDLLICQGYGTMGGQDGPIMLMRNTGGNFTNVTAAAGLNATTTGQQGAVFCDVNNDGWLDIHIQRGTNDSQLYINNKNGTFTQVSVPSGPGFMAGFADLDNDGDWDMVYPGDNKVYLNDGSGTFIASATFSPGTINDPRCVAFADIDDDGDVDFFYAQKRTYNRMIRNDLSGGGNWLKIKLTGENGQAGAFGAKVKTYNAGYAGQAAHLISFREARSNEGYLGQNDPVLHFGVGNRTAVDVQVTYLVSGSTMTFSNVPVNQTLGTQPKIPVINEVTPDPDPVIAGVPYVKQLTLAQGSPYPTWSVIAGPAGLQVSGGGLVSGWTPSSAQSGQLFSITIRATNSQGYDDESWQVAVRNKADFDADGDVDAADFGYLQRCYSGSGVAPASGCSNADLDDDNDVDQTDFNVFKNCLGGADQPPGC